MSPQRFRKRPVEVEAMGPLSPDNMYEIERWCGGLVILDVKPSDHSDVYIGLNIPTLEGVMRAQRGDYIIRGVKGEFYPCKPEIFEATYEPVPAPSAREEEA